MVSEFNYTCKTCDETKEWFKFVPVTDTRNTKRECRKCFSIRVNSEQPLDYGNEKSKKPFTMDDMLAWLDKKAGKKK